MRRIITTVAKAASSKRSSKSTQKEIPRNRGRRLRRTRRRRIREKKMNPIRTKQRQETSISISRVFSFKSYFRV
jgi:hypothetical protein